MVALVILLYIKYLFLLVGQMALFFSIKPLSVGFK